MCCSRRTERMRRNVQISGSDTAPRSAAPGSSKRTVGDAHYRERTVDPLVLSARSADRYVTRRS
jgi:hypothetical protein